MKILIPTLSWSPYGAIVIASVMLGFAVVILFLKRFGVSRQTILYTCLLSAVMTITSSVMFTILQSGSIKTIGFSGLGAVIGMIGGVFISGLIIRDKPECVMASFVATASLMYGLAKFGCLFAGCCHGKPYDGPFAIVYSGADGGSYFPAQIIDMLIFILLFVVGAVLITRMRNKILAIYIILLVLTPVRFLLEYLRSYHEGTLISSGQVTVLIAGAIALILVTVWKGVLRIGKQHGMDASGSVNGDSKTQD